MIDPFDRSLLAHRDREILLRSGKVVAGAEYLVWVLGKDGKVFGACIPGWCLQSNGISSGPHVGLLWWPQGFAT